MNVDVDGLRAAAEAARELGSDEAHQTSDGVTWHSMAYDEDCDLAAASSPDVVLALLDRLHAAEAAVERVRNWSHRVAKLLQQSGYDPLEVLDAETVGQGERLGHLGGLDTARRAIALTLEGVQEATGGDLRASEPQDDHPCYSDALRWAADVAHSEARWQWERDLRRIAGAQIVAQRAEVLEACYREAADRHDKQASGAESDHGDRREGEGLA